MEGKFYFEQSAFNFVFCLMLSLYFLNLFPFFLTSSYFAVHSTFFFVSAESSLR